MRWRAEPLVAALVAFAAPSGPGLPDAGKAQYDREIDEPALKPDNPAAPQSRRLAEVGKQPTNPAADAAALRRQTILLNSQAIAAYREHRYAEAEALAKQAVAILEQAFGPDDAQIAWTLGNLGDIYLDQSRLAEAEPVFKRALAIQERARGPDDLGNATTLIDLARVYQGQRRYAEAEPLLQRAVALRERAHGPEGAPVGQALAQLANLYLEQGLAAKAAPLLQRVQTIEDRTRRRQALEKLSGVMFALGFFSPFAAALFAAYSYARHRRARPDPRRRFPAPAYVAALVIAAGIAFPVGLAFGISSACSPPGASNLCGLVGFFATGPFAAGLAIFVIAGLLLLAPADVRPVPAAVAPYAAFVKLWRGQYPLGWAFWGFLIVGTLALQTGIFFAGFLFAFIGAGRVVMQVVFGAYEIVAAVGVWRSADALAVARGGRAALTYADSAKPIAAKSFVVLWLLANVVLRTRGLYGH